MSVLASIPSPPVSSWSVGPLTIRAYALAIICGIAAAWWILLRRYRAKGGPDVVVGDLLFSMVVFGIVGARIYHVVTDHQLYFGRGKNPLQAFAVWNGGLGIWGAITFGGVGAWLVARRYGLRLMPIGDAIAPALLTAQAIGRIGNYFNQELYGKPTTVPWALEIDARHIVGGYPEATTFHPTFLYELLWCLAGAVLLALLDRRFKLVGGQLFACYVMYYTAGRLWIETLRIDKANLVFGLRLNVWTSIIVFLGGLVAFVVLRRRVKEDPDVDDIWVSDEARQKFLERIGSEEDAEKGKAEKDVDAEGKDGADAGKGADGEEVGERDKLTKWEKEARRKIAAAREKAGLAKKISELAAEKSGEGKPDGVEGKTEKPEASPAAAETADADGGTPEAAREADGQKP